MIESLKLAFRDTGRHVADPAYADIPVEKLLSKDYAKKLSGFIDDSDHHLKRSQGGRLVENSVPEDQLDSLFYP